MDNVDFRFSIMAHSAAIAAPTSGVAALISRTPLITPAKQKFIRYLGRIGFAFKSLVYAILGGLICKSAVSDDHGNESPQGVFVLIAGFPVAAFWLSTLAIGVGVYAFWRFAEAVTGQGCSPLLSTWANFFRFRLSPLVSGIVYATYCVYIVSMIARSGNPPSETAIGPALAFFVALAFLIAFLTQLVHTVVGQFIDELSDHAVSKRPLFLALNVLGRIGFFGRACVFLLVSVLFWKSLAGTLDDDDDKAEPAISRAMATLHNNGGGRAFLFFVGLCLEVYAVFAALCVIYRDFPTRVPTTRPRKSLAARILGHRPVPHVRSVSAPALALHTAQSWEMSTDPVPLPPAREDLPIDTHEGGPSSRLRSPLHINIPTY